MGLFLPLQCIFLARIAGRADDDPGQTGSVFAVNPVSVLKAISESRNLLQSTLKWQLAVSKAGPFLVY
jgi:hypothetical protein